MTTPKRVRVPREKVPYRDRTPVVLEFCTCVWTHDPNQPGTAHIHQADARCPLHGSNVERSPF